MSKLVTITVKSHNVLSDIMKTFKIHISCLREPYFDNIIEQIVKSDAIAAAPYGVK